jgi:ribonuclease BN (tRNA processing enzyme)
MSATYHILGSSSGYPQGGRACSGYVLELNERLSLIDCGGGVTLSLLDSNLDAGMIDRIIISHTHPDHCSDLPLIIQLIHLSGRTDQLDIYVPEEYVVPLGISLRAMYVIPERFAFPIKIHGYGDGFELKVDFHLTALANSHLAGYKADIERLRLPNRCQAHSFQIEVEGRRVFHSADLGGLAEITDHADGCDLVVTELSHVDVGGFLEWAEQSEVGLFVITHLGSEEESLVLDAAIKMAGMENIQLAQDGMKLSF